MRNGISAAPSARTSIVVGLAALLVLGTAQVSQAAPKSISISKTADRTSVYAGEAIGFVITVTNDGSTPVNGVTASDVLPTDAGTVWSMDSQSASACSISSGTMTCSIGTLAAGAAYTAHLTSATTNETVGASPVDNTATASSGKGGSAIASASIEVLAGALVPTRTVAGPIVSRPYGCPPSGPSLLNNPLLCFVGTFNATVIAENGAAVSEGTVTFKSNAYGCLAPVRNGVATCSSSPSPALPYSVTAYYSGSATFGPSSSS